MDTELFEYEVGIHCFPVLSPVVIFVENAFDITLSLSKADRLRTKESAMDHAMVISGVHLDPQSGKPLRYKVENSWGEKYGEKGYYVMTDRWFDEYGEQMSLSLA